MISRRSVLSGLIATPVAISTHGLLSQTPSIAEPLSLLQTAVEGEARLLDRGWVFMGIRTFDVRDGRCDEIILPKNLFTELPEEPKTPVLEDTKFWFETEPANARWA